LRVFLFLPGFNFFTPIAIVPNNQFFPRRATRILL
jgi:hypothetical protein